MPSLCVVGAKCSGHGSFPPRASISGSPNVTIEGMAALRKGDPFEAHCAPQQGCHDGVVSGGSGTVKINGMAAARIGDAVSCGSVIADSGTTTVFCN
ncbi:MAG: PAAR domain-containing protein [Ghiorsea sp.]